MIESTRIEDIKERVSDFCKALRKGSAPELAARIEGYSAGFIDVTQVRRSVAAIKQQLEYWRAHPEELPDMPIVHIAANRLEDACADALRAGVIVPARPSIRTEGRRKLTLVVTALAAGGLVFFVPLVITMLGIDLTDPHVGREAAPIRLAQGEEGGVPVNVLVESVEPALTRGVEVYPTGQCEKPLSAGATCKRVDVQEWNGAKLPTYELMLQDQAYGLLFAIDEQRVLGQTGAATVRVSATDDTPEGSYRIPLSAAFIGYTPAHCTLIERASNKCVERRVGDDARHDDLPVPTVVVNVVKGDPSRRKNEEQRRAAEIERKQKEAEERAKQIESALSQIKLVLDDTQDMLRRKRYELARERIEKLSQLFAPLDSLSVDRADSEVLPVEVSKLRTRFESQVDVQKRFEEQVFERAYAALTAAENKTRGEELIMADVARRSKVSPDYVTAIYTAHAEEIEKRLDAQRQKRLEAERLAMQALQARCGALPTGAWKAVDDYLKNLVRDGKTKLGECLTPRLSAEHCWTVNCSFKVTTVTSQNEQDRITSFTKTFLLRNERVVSHMKEALP